MNAVVNRLLDKKDPERGLFVIYKEGCVEEKGLQICMGRARERNRP